MSKIKLLYSLVILIIAFTACNKDDESQTPEVTQQNCLLSKVLDHNNLPVIEVTYNSNKQAVNYINYTNGDSYTYTYTNGKLATATHARIYPSPSDFRRTYIIDADGLVTKEILTSPTNANNQLFGIFDYDSEKRKIRYQFFEKGVNGQPDKFRSKEWYHHNSDGNIEKSLYTYNYATPQDTVGYGTIYEYDNKPNPFYPLRNLPSVWTGSKNNPTKAIAVNYDSVGTLVSQTLSGNYQNEYNKDGLIIKSTYIPAGGSASTIRKYEYICN